MREIREIRKTKRLLKIIAHDFGVTPATICDICNRKSWKHIE